MKNINVFFNDENKVFCRVRKIKNVVKFLQYRKNNRLYFRCGSRLLPATQTIGDLRDLANSGDLFIWTGDKH